MAEQTDDVLTAPDLKFRRRSEKRARAEADRAFAVLWYALRNNITAQEAEKVMPAGGPQAAAS